MRDRPRGESSAHLDWALVLAGGRGRRMAGLTVTDAGVSCPKQFCSLGPGPSLVHAALRRASAVAPSERTLITVTESHRCWWEGLSSCLPSANIVIQPEQRGTGVGILQPLLEILRRDSSASLLILPADHFFREEDSIDDGLRTAMKLTRKYPRHVLLLGFEPKEPDEDLGYIVPAAAQEDSLFAVSHFVEKPDASTVSGLIDRGALWNSFILAAEGHALLAAFERHYPAAVAALRRIVEAPCVTAEQRAGRARLFGELPTIDFSADVVAAELERLLVLRLPRCGWSDVGTPARLERVLRQHGQIIDATTPAPLGLRGHVDLAARSRCGDTRNPRP